MNDEPVRLAAIEFARRNKMRIARLLTDPVKYASEVIPISVFMAGSPGAGKTEFSKNLIRILEAGQEHRVVRIDADEIRPLIPGYTGGNSSLFQGATSLIVEKMHDLALRQKQSFILDSTFSQYEKAGDNIRRSLAKDRPVLIFYIYQTPEVAWKFTQAREKAEGRNIPKSAFIEQFLGAREAVERVAGAFGNKVVISLVQKDFEKNTVENIVKLESGKTQIDDHILERYSRESLEKRI